MSCIYFFFFFSSRRRHTRSDRDWSSDVCSSDLDITGPIDSSVERDTVRAYMQAVNASGGINGRQVEYVWCDSKYDASSAHSCAQQMIAQNVMAVVGLTAPLGENNEIRTLTAAGIPVIG